DRCDHEYVARDGLTAGQVLRGPGRGCADDEVAHAVPGGIPGDDQQHERGDADQRVAAEQIVGHPAPCRGKARPGLRHLRTSRTPTTAEYSQEAVLSSLR